jgi:hypothetical protein
METSASFEARSAPLPYSTPMPEKHRHIVSSLRGKPFSAVVRLAHHPEGTRRALNGPVPCRPPPDPLQGCLFLRSGPERKLNVSLSAALNGSPLGSKEKEKPGRYESRRTEKIRCQRAGTFKVRHGDWRFEYSVYAYLGDGNVKRTYKKFWCDWVREVEAHCAGLRSGPAFLVKRCE